MFGSNPQSKGGPGNSQYNFNVAVILLLFSNVHLQALTNQLNQEQVVM